MLFDANALMIPLEHGVDLFSEVQALIGAFEPVVPLEVKNELSGIAHQRGRRGAAARFGLALAGRCSEESLGEEEGLTVDDRIAQYARINDCMVATSDRELRRALLRDGVPVLTLRGPRRITLERR
ncbi:MAG: PIN domain-containing protein [Methanoregulaceae archaeon]